MWGNRLKLREGPNVIIKLVIKLLDFVPSARERPSGGGYIVSSTKIVTARG